MESARALFARTSDKYVLLPKRKPKERKMNKLGKIVVLLSIITLTTSILLPLSSVRAEDQSLFKLTIIAPGNANMVRRQWSQIFANSLRLLGIDARVVYLGWASVYDRVLTPPRDMVGKKFEDGGFDVLSLGWTPGLNPEPRQVLYGGSDFFAPDGQNYYLYNTTQSNLLLDQFITATDVDTQNQSLQAWQSLYMDEMPSSQIVYQSAPAIVNPVLSNFGQTANGEGWLYFNAQPNPEWLKGKSSVVYCSTGEIQSLIPPLSNSWYDTIIISCLYSGLAVTNNDLSDLATPGLLTSWEKSADGFNWTYNLRHGVKWHDGYLFSADDILFSLWALMNPETASQFVGYYRNVYGDNVKFTWENGTSTFLGNGSRYGTITAVDPYTVKFNLPVLTLGKPYGYFDPYLLTLANNIIPKHIFEKIQTAEWSATPFNTGQGEIVIPGVGSYTGPVGTGPYKWVGFNPVTQVVHMQKFNDYWNKTALELDGMFQVNDYYVRFIADKTGALAALKNGEVDMLDANYQMQVDIPTIDLSWGRVLLHEGTGRQEFGYNLQHPIIGTGVDTPLGRANSSRAAEAGKYVRIALDYAIPRQLIIDNLLAGYGDPGATVMLPTQPFYNSSIAARPYDLAKAREYLEKAGYTTLGPPPPTISSFTVGMSDAISGYYTDSDGNPMPSRELQLMVTTDNTTYASASEIVARTTTDLNGWYTFTATPPTNGTFYYYLFDGLAPAGSEWKYVRMLNATTMQDTLAPLQNQVSNLQNSLNTMTYIAVAALVIAILIGVVTVFMPRKKSQ
jgi:ABC-type transport system substrate-binding protein